MAHTLGFMLIFNSLEDLHLPELTWLNFLKPFNINIYRRIKKLNQLKSGLSEVFNGLHQRIYKKNTGFR